MQEGDLLTGEEAATLLRVSVWTIRAWLSQGRLPRVKVGRLTRVRRTDLEAFLKDENSCSDRGGE